jgi:hypothetical protein
MTAPHRVGRDGLGVEPMTPLEERMRAIVDQWGPLLRRLSGVDDVVTGVCPGCQFEQGRASTGGSAHSPICAEPADREVGR